MQNAYNAPFLPYAQRIRILNADIAARPKPATADDPNLSNGSSSTPSTSKDSSSSSNVASTSTGYTSQASSSSEGKSERGLYGLQRSIAHYYYFIIFCLERSSIPVPLTHFERLVEIHKDDMPPPGLDYFERQRALWYTPPSNPPSPPSPSPSRVKLEALLGQPGAVESEEVWKAGLKNVWKGLVGGNQLRKRLPLTIVVRLAPSFFSK